MVRRSTAPPRRNSLYTRFEPYKNGSEKESSFLETSESSSSESEREKRRAKERRQSSGRSPDGRRRPPPPAKNTAAKPLAKKKAPTPATQYRPSRAVIQEIRTAQKLDHCIPRAPFHRLVRELTIQLGGNELRYSLAALTALQEAAEAYVTGILEDSYLLAIHAKRVTLMAKDLQLAYRIRGDGMRF